MRYPIALFFFLFYFTTLAPAQDIVLNYEEGFQGGTVERWKYKDQFSYKSDYGSMYGVIKSPGSGKEFDFPFPEFNNANDKLGRDFILSFKLGNLEPKVNTDTSLFGGFMIVLGGDYKLGLSVNGLGKFRAYGHGKSFLPIKMDGKCAPHKKWGEFSLSELKVQKKYDSLIFWVNQKPVLRTRILIKSDINDLMIGPADLSFKKSWFQASSEQSLDPKTSFLIDHFQLTWFSRPGDILFADGLLSEKLRKYPFYSKPYFGKYIVAKNAEEQQCVLNLYGNYIIPPTYDPIRLTNQAGIFVKQDGGREEFYNGKGEYEEFGEAKTKALLASQKEPAFLQQKLSIEPLRVTHFNPAVKPKDNAGKFLTAMESVGIFKENGKTGLSGKSGSVYFYPGFDDIWLHQYSGPKDQFSTWEAEYKFAAKWNGQLIYISIIETNPDKLFYDLELHQCKKCNGEGYILVKANTISYKIICPECKSSGYSESSKTYLIWNKSVKAYEKKTEREKNF